MIEKIVGIVLDKFLQPRTRKQKADDEVKEKLVFLHECLVNCHHAYLQYSSEEDDTNLENWKKAVRDLSYVLDEVGLALSSFSPDTFNYAADYCIREAPMAAQYNDDDDEAQELKRTVARVELLRSREPQERYDDDFTEATTRLREFMKGHMTAGEIQQAQEAFRRITYWKQSW